MSEFLKRTWAEVDLDAIVHNYEAVKNVVGDARVMAVVKADAYGHGVCRTAPVLYEAGARWFGVSNLEEALQLRRTGISGSVLILGYTPPEYASTLAEENLSQTVFSADYARALAGYARAAHVKVAVHIKLDTGMSRLGFCADTSCAERNAGEIAGVFDDGSLLPQGIFSHFSSADFDGDPDGSFTDLQLGRYFTMLELLRSKGVAFELRHICNSAGIFTRPEAYLDLVRPGIMLYGLMPAPELQHPLLKLQPALSLKTIVSMVKYIKKGTTVSYGRTFTADSDLKIATVPIGYADGYPRVLSGRAQMLVRGRRVPVIGRVCMDQLMLDVSEIDGVEAGDLVTVFGRDGDGFIPVDELSRLASTVNYETVCLIGKRVPRIFYQNGIQTGQLNYITDSF